MTNKGTEEKIERNAQLIKDYLAVNEDGEYLYSVSTDLVAKYQISAPRIYELLERHGIKKRMNKNGKGTRKQKG